MKKNGELKVEYINTGELKTYENNAKLHPAEQIEQIKKSIEQFGMNDPIAVWKDNIIIEGHGRLIACKELDIKQVPIIRLDGLTDEQRKAYGLIHNKLTMSTGFDYAMLYEELQNINNYDMKDFGFFEGLEEDIDTLFDDDCSTEDIGEKEEAEAASVICPYCGEVNEI